MRWLAAAPLIGLGLLVGLYGFLALIYDEGGGDSYVTLAGHRVDADLVGAASLALGAALLGVAVAILRHAREHP